jgi:hypothetical protein
MDIAGADPFELYNALNDERWQLSAQLGELPSQSLRAREIRARVDELEAALKKIVEDAGPYTCFARCCNPLPGEIPGEAEMRPSPATVTCRSERENPERAANLLGRFNYPSRRIPRNADSEPTEDCHVVDLWQWRNKTRT